MDLRPPPPFKDIDLDRWAKEIYRNHLLTNVLFETKNDTTTLLNGNTLRYSSRATVQELDGKNASAALYIYVDPHSSSGADVQKVGIQFEITDNQADGYGGAISVQHYGHGDSIYVAQRGEGGAAIEAASYVDSTATYGSKGFISTIQADTPKSSNVLFDALWAKSTIPLYGMFYADQSPGNALTIRKYSSTTDSTTQIRLWEYDLSRSRFEVLNDGTTRVSSLAATSGTTTQDSPPITMRGAHWNGSANVNDDWSINVDVTATSPTSRLLITAPTGGTSIQPNGNKTIDLGVSGVAWDDVWCDDVQDEADIPFLDIFDDLKALMNVKGSGKIDSRTKLEIVDDATLPDFIKSKSKDGSEIVFDPDGKPYFSLRAMSGWLMGCIKQLNKKYEEHLEIYHKAGV